MAGSNHTGRRPTRLSSIGKRDARSIADRRRVSEADIRQSIYVRPLGPAYDVFKNPCNDQEYVAANGTGSTHSAGQVVPLGSFSGNPGEFSFGRPPAGFGGASGYSVNRVSAGYGYQTSVGPLSGTVVSRNYLGYCCAWDSFGNGALIPMERTMTENSVNVRYVDLVLIAAADTPTAAVDAISAPGTIVASVAHADYVPILIGSVPGPRYYMVVNDPSVVYASGEAFRMVWFDLDGTADATSDPWNGPSAGLGYGVLSGGVLYTLVPDDDPTTTGSPEPSFYMIRKWAYGNATPQASYSYPSVTPYGGFSSLGQKPAAITPGSGGGVDVWVRNDKNLSTSNYWRRSLNSSLTPVGADVSLAGIDNVAYSLDAFTLTMVGMKSGGTYVCKGGKIGSGTGDDYYIVTGVAVTSDLLVNCALSLSFGDAIAYKHDGGVLFHTMGASLIAYLDSAGVLHEP